MSTPTHMAVGLWVTQIVPNPMISLPLALGSHFVLDLIPHNDYFYYHLGRKFKHAHESPLSWIMLGMGFGFSVYLALHVTNYPIALLGAVLGSMPDVIMALTKRIWFFDNSVVRLFNRIHIDLAHSRFDLGECFYNLTVKASHKVVFPKNSRERRKNYDQMNDSIWSFFGWIAESLFEIIILLSITFWILR